MVIMLTLDFLQSRSRVESNARFVQSKLNFVDLAGSERLSKTQVRSSLIGCQLVSLSSLRRTAADNNNNDNNKCSSMKSGPLCYSASA